MQCIRICTHAKRIKVNAFIQNMIDGYLTVPSWFKPTMHTFYTLDFFVQLFDEWETISFCLYKTLWIHVYQAWVYFCLRIGICLGQMMSSFSSAKKKLTICLHKIQNNKLNHNMCTIGYRCEPKRIWHWTLPQDGSRSPGLQVGGVGVRLHVWRVQWFSGVFQFCSLYNMYSVQFLTCDVAC